MSHSVPADSSAIAYAFGIGPDLVAFDRSGLPIHAAGASLWAEAGKETHLFGTSVDQVFGDGSDVFIASLPLAEEPREFNIAVDDSLVVISPLGDDAFISPVCEHQPALDPSVLHAHHPADLATVYDFSGDSHFLLPVHGGAGWDLARPDWFYDHHF